MIYLINDIELIIVNIFTIGVHLTDQDIITDDLLNQLNQNNLFILEDELKKLKFNLANEKNITEITLIIATISESIEILKRKINYDLLKGEE